MLAFVWIGCTLEDCTNVLDMCHSLEYYPSDDRPALRHLLGPASFFPDNILLPKLCIVLHGATLWSTSEMTDLFVRRTCTSGECNE
jgi:hypothetical protein